MVRNQRRNATSARGSASVIASAAMIGTPAISPGLGSIPTTSTPMRARQILEQRPPPHPIFDHTAHRQVIATQKAFDSRESPQQPIHPSQIAMEFYQNRPHRLRRIHQLRLERRALRHFPEAKPSARIRFMQIRPLHPQRPRRARDIPARFLERRSTCSRSADSRASCTLERGPVSSAASTPAAPRQNSAHRPPRESPSAPPHCATRAHSQARILFERLPNFRLETLSAEPIPHAEIFQKIFGHRSDILRTLAQRGHPNRPPAHPVKQILANLPAPPCRQIAVSSPTPRAHSANRVLPPTR